MIGKLLLRKVKGFRITPFPSGSRFDALLTVTTQEIELEITAFVKPAYQRSIDRLCRKVEDWLHERFPEKAFEVQLGNIGGMFEELEGESGETALDVERTYSAILECFSQAIDENGTVQGDWSRFAVRGPVVLVRPADATYCWQSAFAKPGGTSVAQAKRKIETKIKADQWSGTRPGALAVVLQHDPDPSMLNASYDSACDEAFARIPHLALIVALPYGNFLSEITFFTPENPTGLQVLHTETMRTLLRAFHFWLGVDCRLALSAFREVREARKRDGTWKGLGGNATSGVEELRD